MKHIIQQFDNGIKLELDTFELGQIDNDFIDNLKIIIGNTLIESITNPIENNAKDETISMNLFLNSIKAGKTFGHQRYRRRRSGSQPGQFHRHLQPGGENG